MEYILTILLLIIGSSCTIFSSPARPQRRMSQSLEFNETLLALDPRRLQKRQTTPVVTTCGYQNEDRDSLRTADPGFGCRFDTSGRLWGFCPTTVVEATNCGFPGYCEDEHSCRSGCGRTFALSTQITAITCEKEDFCSTAILINELDQLFTYIACGQTNTVDILLAVPNAASATTTSISSGSSTSATLSSKFVTEPSYTSTNTAPRTPNSQASPSTSLSPSGTSSESLSMKNIGAIVGGSIAGLVVICGTIIALCMIKRKRKVSPVVSASIYNQDEYIGVVNSEGHAVVDGLGKSSFFKSTNEPVEMDVRDVGKSSPAEMPGKNTPKSPGTKVL